MSNCSGSGSRAPTCTQSGKSGRPESAPASVDQRQVVPVRLPEPHVNVIGTGPM